MIFLLVTQCLLDFVCEGVDLPCPLRLRIQHRAAGRQGRSKRDVLAYLGSKDGKIGIVGLDTHPKVFVYRRTYRLTVHRYYGIASLHSDNLSVAIGQNIVYDRDMMSSTEFTGHLKRLALSEAEAARLLSVTPRTVRRWAEGSTEVPGPVEQALRAWLQLDDRHLVWRPDGVAIWEVDQMELFRGHAKELVDLIKKVESRGGPAAPWKVDLAARRASLGPIEVSFHVLANENFSPSCYTRKDRSPDLKRDWGLLEDAFYCIATAIGEAGKGWSERQ